MGEYLFYIEDSEVADPTEYYKEIVDIVNKTYTQEFHEKKPISSQYYDEQSSQKIYKLIIKMLASYSPKYDTVE